MKILKWIGSALLLSGLAVSLAGAASFPVDYNDPVLNMSANNLYLAEDPSGDSTVDPGPPTGTAFTHAYEFDVQDPLGLVAETFLSYTIGTAEIANLVFDWGVGGQHIVSDAAGNLIGPTTFARTLDFGLRTLTVSGLVIGSPLVGTRYDFSIVTTSVPIPAAFWLFGSALVGFIGFSRRKTA